MSKSMVVVPALFAVLGAASMVLAAGRGPGPETIPVSVDYYDFSLQSTARAGESAFDIVIDVRSVEALLEEDDLFHHVDLNEDGEASFIDSVIYVFERGTGVLGGFGDLVGFNDDDEFNKGFGDGSISSLDSFMRLSLPAGDYVLAISTFDLSEAEARAGSNLVFDGPFTIREDQTDWENFDHGDYRVAAYFDAPIPSRGDTIFVHDGEIEVLPAPAAIAAFGLAGVALLRRRRA